MSKLSITIDGYTCEVELVAPLDGRPQATLLVDGQPVQVNIPGADAGAASAEWFIVDERPYEVNYDQDLKWLRSPLGIHSLEVQDLEISIVRPATGDGRIKAPIPGHITQVMAAVGEDVSLGQPLLVLEAMKMENEIRAPRSGRLKTLNVLPGQRVTLHEVLAEIE